VLTLALFIAAALVTLARAVGVAAVRVGQLAAIAFARVTAPPPARQARPRRPR